MRWLARFAVCLLLLTPALPASAADTLRAAAIVNDEVISELDLKARIKLVRVSSGLKGNPDNRALARQILRNLINERLQLQEARRLDIEVAEKRVEKATAELASRNNMSREAFLDALARNGILPETLTARVRANLAWQKVLARKVRPQVSVDSEDVNEVVERRKARAGQRLLRLREIYLPVEDGSAGEVRKTAKRLMRELRNGANFDSLARQFSQAPTAATGGDLGWITPASLPDPLARVARDLNKGRVAGPVKARNGLYILALQDARRTTAGATTVTLKQVLIPLPDDADDQTAQDVRGRLTALSERIQGCDDVASVVEGLDKVQRVDLGQMKLGDMPERIRKTVGGLDVGDVSAPIRAGGGLGVVVVCERQTAGLDREKIRRNLIRGRMQQLAQRYLRDLRRAAHIEIRLKTL